VTVAPAADRGYLCWLAVAYVLLVPLAWAPLPLNIKWADIVFVPLAVATMVAARGRRYRPHRLDSAVLLWLLAPLPSYAATSDAGQSGLEHLKLAYLAAVYGITALLAARSVSGAIVRGLAGIGGALAALGLLACALYLVAGVEMTSLGRSMPLPYVGSVLRLYGATESPAMLASILTVTVPFAVVLAVQSPGASIWWAVAAVAAAAAALTATASLVGVAVAAIVVAWPLLRGAQLGWVRWPALVAVVLFVLITNALLVASVRGVRLTGGRDASVPPAAYPYAFQEPQGARTVTLTASYHLMSYFLMKRVAADAFVEHPLTGTGLGTFHQLTEKAYQRGEVPSDYFRTDPHSTLLGTLAETGLPGGAALVLLWVMFLRAAVRLHRRTARVGPGLALAAALVGLLVSSVNADVMNFRFLWVALGLVRGLEEHA